MNSLITWILLAESRPMFYLGDRFDPGRSQFNISAVRALAAATALAAFVAWIWSRRGIVPERKIINDPHKLLAELAHVHGLSRSQKVLLARLARQLRLELPALIAVDPAILQRAATAAGKGPLQQSIKRLQVKLFANTSPKR